MTDRTTPRSMAAELTPAQWDQMARVLTGRDMADALADPERAHELYRERVQDRPGFVARHGRQPMARPMTPEELERAELRPPEPVRLSTEPCASAGCLARSVYARAYCPGHLAAPAAIDPDRVACSADRAMREIAGILWPEEYAADPDEELPAIAAAVADVLMANGYGRPAAPHQEDDDPRDLA